jgi:preprotein translocase subunit SecE
MMTEEIKDTTATSESKEETKTASKETKPKKKGPNPVVTFFKKIWKFFKECKSELKKIVWASPASTLKNTIIVTIAIIVFAAFFFACDWLFRDIVIAGLCKIPEWIGLVG